MPPSSGTDAVRVPLSKPALAAGRPPVPGTVPLDPSAIGRVTPLRPPSTLPAAGPSGVTLSPLSCSADSKAGVKATATPAADAPGAPGAPGWVTRVALEVSVSEKEPNFW